MTKEELEKDYYAGRPTDPDSVDESAGDWADIAYYAEENLEKAFKRIAELEVQIEKMKCGQNCKHSYLYQEDRKCKFTYCDCINCKDKWELRR